MESFPTETRNMSRSEEPNSFLQVDIKSLLRRVADFAHIQNQSPSAKYTSSMVPVPESSVLVLLQLGGFLFLVLQAPDACMTGCMVRAMPRTDSRG